MGEEISNLSEDLYPNLIVPDNLDLLLLNDLDPTDLI